MIAAGPRCRHPHRGDDRPDAAARDSGSPARPWGERVAETEVVGRLPAPRHHRPAPLSEPGGHADRPSHDAPAVAPMACRRLPSGPRGTDHRPHPPRSPDRRPHRGGGDLQRRQGMRPGDLRPAPGALPPPQRLLRRHPAGLRPGVDRLRADGRPDRPDRHPPALPGARHLRLHAPRRRDQGLPPASWRSTATPRPPSSPTPTRDSWPTCRRCCRAFWSRCESAVGGAP